MEKLFIFTDGGARGNPGPAAVGVVIKAENQRIIATLSRMIGTTTNNVAEYSAVIEALEWLRNNPITPASSAGRQSSNPPARLDSAKRVSKTGNPMIQFFLDSKLVVNQLNGLFKVKDSQLRNLLLKIRQLEQEVGGNVIYSLVPREKNQQADALVNKALDLFFYAQEKNS